MTSWLLKHWTEYADFPATEIAKALGAINRYGGQYPEGRRPLSVARHSVLVAELLGEDSPHVRLAAMVHDVHECWTGDLLRPIFSELPDAARQAIHAVQEDIDWYVHNRMLKVELTSNEWHRVQEADDAACKAELAYLACPETATDPVFRSVCDASLLWSPQYDAAIWLRVFEMVRKELT